MAKIYSLQVRPLRSAELAFHLPGILFRRSDNAYLGKSVNKSKLNVDGTDFDLQIGILKVLSKVNAEGKIENDSEEINTKLLNSSLFEIYNETAKTSLDQMILQRQKAFLERYKHNNRRLQAIRRLFPSGEDSLGSRTSGSKLWHIDRIRTSSQSRHDALDTAYLDAQEDNIDRSGVVKKQLTKTDNTNNYSADNIITAKTKINPITLVTPQHETEVQDKDGNVKEKLIAKEVKSEQRKADNNAIENGHPSQEVSTIYPAGEGTKLDQSSYNHYSEFLHPKLTNTIRNSRVQVELMQQELTDSLYAFRVDDLTNIWNNELGGLDREVRKYQIALIRTFLLPPFKGVVTAVYKDVGESVEIGEPVLRIEDDEKLLLVGLINHRGSLRIGDTAIIKTNDLFESGKEFEIKDFKVVSIRGHNSDNDVWDVILQGKNPKDDNGKTILPINYQFDKDNVTVEFSSH
ncbi:MAG: HlyD family secretion protein [Cyanobacteria bacterium SBLK]|nr:HlyD family secretion protein [Cyanobacteria bacterium SBLK]